MRKSEKNTFSNDGKQSLNPLLIFREFAKMQNISLFSIIRFLKEFSPLALYVEVIGNILARVSREIA